MTKYVFVTGGVISGLGKGVAMASIGALLETQNHKIGFMKLDPYINIDPGTMSPEEHGEVFVTEDGRETDLDLGHYERFTHVKTAGSSNVTSGQIYHAVLAKERKGEFLGQTVQVVPHITGEMKARIYAEGAKCEILLVEIGGTVGDIESSSFVEAIREIRNELPREGTALVHLALIVTLKNGEKKTKPVQQSVRMLNSLGLIPDLLLCRTTDLLSQEERTKIGRFTNVLPANVFSAQDVECIYDIPERFALQGVHFALLNALQIPSIPHLCQFPKPVFTHETTIGIVGKYTSKSDAYLSLQEAFAHAGRILGIRVRLQFLQDGNGDSSPSLADVDGIVVPGGFGIRGTQEKLHAIRYARERDIPFFGICLGMQLAIIEYARNVLEVPDADSQEFSESCTPVIHKMDSEIVRAGKSGESRTQQEFAEQKGASMRLGAYDCLVTENSHARKIYLSEMIRERHRHRYEVNVRAVPELFEHDLQISGRSKDGKFIEMVELANHKWFIGVQFHPEFLSNPRDGHPLFLDFVKTCI